MAAAEASQANVARSEGSDVVWGSRSGSGLQGEGLAERSVNTSCQLGGGRALVMCGINAWGGVGGAQDNRESQRASLLSQLFSIKSCFRLVCLWCSLFSHTVTVVLLPGTQRRDY